MVNPCRPIRASCASLIEGSEEGYKFLQTGAGEKKCTPAKNDKNLLKCYKDIPTDYNVKLVVECQSMPPPPSPPLDASDASAVG